MMRTKKFRDSIVLKGRKTRFTGFIAVVLDTGAEWCFIGEYYRDSIVLNGLNTRSTSNEALFSTSGQCHCIRHYRVCPKANKWADGQVGPTKIPEQGLQHQMQRLTSLFCRPSLRVELSSLTRLFDFNFSGN